jgi:hypothetical protein
VSAMDALARLRIVQNSVIAVDLMLGLKIVAVGSSPMPFDRCPSLAISRLIVAHRSSLRRRQSQCKDARSPSGVCDSLLSTWWHADFGSKVHFATTAPAAGRLSALAGRRLLMTVGEGSDRSAAEGRRGDEVERDTREAHMTPGVRLEKTKPIGRAIAIGQLLHPVVGCRSGSAPSSMKRTSDSQRLRL